LNYDDGVTWDPDINCDEYTITLINDDGSIDTVGIHDDMTLWSDEQKKYRSGTFLPPAMFTFTTIELVIGLPTHLHVQSVTMTTFGHPWDDGLSTGISYNTFYGGSGDALQRYLQPQSTECDAWCLATANWADARYWDHGIDLYFNPVPGLNPVGGTPRWIDVQAICQAYQAGGGVAIGGIAAEWGYYGDIHPFTGESIPSSIDNLYIPTVNQGVKWAKTRVRWPTNVGLDASLHLKMGVFCGDLWDSSFGVYTQMEAKIWAVQMYKADVGALYLYNLCGDVDTGA